MVWAAIVFFLTTVAAGYLAHTYRRDFLKECDAHEAMGEQACIYAEQTRDANKRADDAMTRYDALVEKIRIQSSKPKDDGIIHAKNSGDVRRIYEQAVSAEMVKREKDLEN
jgi:hypothetical protein